MRSLLDEFIFFERFANADILYEELTSVDKKIEFLKSQASKRWTYIKDENKDVRDNIDYTDFNKYKTVDDFVNHIIKIDPTNTKIYAHWIQKLILKDHSANKIEDLYKVEKDLAVFDKNKAKIEIKDINKVKDFEMLADLVAPFQAPKSAAQKRAEAKLAKADLESKDNETIYSGPEGWIKIPNNMAAAKRLGRGTKWCTSASKSNNLFNTYNEKDKLFIIYDKDNASSKLWQLHIKTQQFANSSDKMYDLSLVPLWAKKPIADWYTEHPETIGLSQMTTLLNKFGIKVKSMHKEHDDVLDLMSQYGV